jgi:hypothetical protein
LDPRGAVSVCVIDVLLRRLISSLRHDWNIAAKVIAVRDEKLTSHEAVLHNPPQISAVIVSASPQSPVEKPEGPPMNRLGWSWQRHSASMSDIEWSSRSASVIRAAYSYGNAGERWLPSRSTPSRIDLT